MPTSSSGKLSIHHPGNRSRIVFDTQTQYKRDLIPLYPQQPNTWGPPKPQYKRFNVPIKGSRPWKNYPQLIIVCFQPILSQIVLQHLLCAIFFLIDIKCFLSAQNCLNCTASPQTTYQRQVLNDMSSESDARTTPGLYSDNLLDSDELTHDLLLNALSTWRTTWYLDNKWRDSNLDNLIVVRKQFNCSYFAFSCICFTRISYNKYNTFLVNANLLRYLINKQGTTNCR